MQYYIAQSPAQTQQPSSPSSRNILTSTPVVWTILVTAIISGLFGALINHLLTKKRDRAKAKEELYLELKAQTMTINIDRMFTKIDEKLDTISQKVDANTTSIKENAKAIQQLPTREEMNAGFTKVNERIDNLIKGTPGEGQI